MRSGKRCGCGPAAKARTTRTPTDTTIKATPEELQSIRKELAKIEKPLSAMFREAYARGPTSEKAMAEAADVIDDHFCGIVEEWENAVAAIFDANETKEEPNDSLKNALIRFVARLRDRDDIATYVHLRKHCQEGMLSRALPSQFNVVHIALKQIVLDHIKAALRGPKMEVVRDAAVAAIDERRLMVAQFYIASRERALRASEEKYRNSINHAPDPMYEIDPVTLEVLSANSAAVELHRRRPYEPDRPLVGERLTNLTPAELQPLVYKHIETVRTNGSGQALDLELR